jgi:hypothetical protein
MNPSLDPATQQLVDEFRQRIAEAERYQQYRLRLLVADRLQQDLLLLDAPTRPRQPPLHRVVAHMARRFTHRPRQVEQSTQEAAMVVDASYIELPNNTSPTTDPGGVE